MLAAAWAAAAAAWVTALAVITGVFWWLLRQYPQAMAAARHWLTTLIHAEKVTLTAGVTYALRAAKSGHPPYTATDGPASAEQPLGYLLGKTTETVWAAVSSAHSELEPYLVPMRNYLTALAAKAGLSQAQDFALGVLTERVRQEEDGWPDQPGDPGGKRCAHGTGEAHTCLLERKHQVENAIYAIEISIGRRMPSGSPRLWCTPSSGDTTGRAGSLVVNGGGAAWALGSVWVPSDIAERVRTRKLCKTRLRTSGRAADCRRRS